MTFIDLEGDGPRSFIDVQTLMDATPPDATPTANIRRLAGRLQMRFEPIAWGFTPRGRLLGASFSYGTDLDTDLLLAELDAAHAALFDEDNATIFPPSSIEWPWVEADWVVEWTSRPDPSPGLVLHLGDRVSHDEYGNGTVERISEQGPWTHATIAFDNAETATFMVRDSGLRLL